MLQVVIPETELYDESSGEFIYTKRYVVQLEHSLVSVSKWESKWERPFLVDDPPKTTEQVVDYYRCMALTKGIPDESFYCIPESEMERINSYIKAKRSATTITNHENRPPSREIVTSEVIYYWMVAHQIPFECEKWHLNRLLMLIQVCNAKNTPGKKMSVKDAHALNMARRARHKKR